MMALRVDRLAPRLAMQIGIVSERQSGKTAFFAIIRLFVDDLVVYTLHGGQPRMHDKEVTKNPLGPLQGWGQQVGPQIFD